MSTREQLSLEPAHLKAFASSCAGQFWGHTRGIRGQTQDIQSGCSPSTRALCPGHERDGGQTDRQTEAAHEGSGKGLQDKGPGRTL